jgi:OOP family OmpA-OmpF porin
MNDAPGHPRASSDDVGSLKEDWAQLRSLLLAPEQTQLDELRERLDNPVVHARDVSRVLPDAVALRGTSDPHLTSALTPYVEEGFAAAVRKSPRTIADAIAPLMGQAIRQAIVRTLQAMVQSLNHTLEDSLSVRGLRWRLEAWRTGRPFAEVVLLHTLTFRVEQVYLLHRSTGLLLHHVAADAAAVRDPYAVSGMLPAIQRFVQDSFDASREHTLDPLQVGEWTVWVEQGTDCVLAGVIRGTPPLSLRRLFQQVLERIQAQQAQALAQFDGDTGAFAASHSLLESCLQAQYQSTTPDRSRALWIFGSLLMSGCLIGGWSVYHAHQRWTAALAALKGEPGLVVTAAEASWNGYRIEGLRDPAAKDPAVLLEAAGIAPDQVVANWASFYALDPALVLGRARSILRPPDRVTVEMEGTTLIVRGTASADWAREARQRALFIPGVSAYHDEQLTTVSLDDVAAQIEQTTLHFAPASSTLDADQQSRVMTLRRLLHDLDDALSELGRRASVEIIGSADETGPETMNLLLSEARAHAVLAALGGKQVGRATTLTTGIDAPTAKARRGPLRNAAVRRAVSLHVILGDPVGPR